MTDKAYIYAQLAVFRKNDQKSLAVFRKNDPKTLAVSRITPYNNDMLRRKIQDYLEKWKNNRKTALIVKGARQVGKTFSIKNFAYSHFENVIEINFADNPEYIETFALLKNADQLMIRLSAIAGDKLVKNKTIVFFDEIQLLYKRRVQQNKENIDLLTALKKHVIKGEYRFILSGSLLGVNLNNILLYPTGYVDDVEMYPLDFEEYLWAKGLNEDTIDYVKNCFYKEKEVDEHVNSILLNHFREYVLIGGMPESVEEFINTNNLYNVNLIQQQIINKYSFDITTYVEDEEKKLIIKEIYKSIASELNEKNKRFVSSHVLDSNYLKNNNIIEEYLWLSNAGIVIPVYNVNEPTVPLTLSSSRKTLKLFANDTGLLTSMLVSTGIRERLLNDDISINYGAPYENIAAQQLYSHGFNEKLFYYNSKKHGEVDFLIEYNSEVIPIEIKSGKEKVDRIYNHTALNNLIKMYKYNKAYVFANTNLVKENEVITQFPIYMVSFLINK